eukprot:12516778-Alexandrium_andersonii.AAC.1
MNGLPAACRNTYQHWRVFLFGSDQGSDQRAADKLIAADAACGPLVLIFRQRCIQHCSHLMTKR